MTALDVFAFIRAMVTDHQERFEWVVTFQQIHALPETP